MRLAASPTTPTARAITNNQITNNMKRFRFYLDKEACGYDYRPVVWPIRHPYWCSGENADSFILIAYAESEDEIRSQWPEVEDFDFVEDVEGITVSSRFPKPDWYCPCHKEGGEE